MNKSVPQTPFKKLMDMNKLFTQRYGNLIKESDFIGEYPHEFRQDVFDLLLSFNEEWYHSPNRFNPRYHERTDSCMEIFKQYSKYLNRKVDIDDLQYYLSMPQLFDIIELWYADISMEYKNDFINELNELFDRYDLQWRLLSGKLIKMDSQQFEQDLANKLLELMECTQAENPVFQTAYEEFIMSINKLSSGNYAEAITYACNSYESTLKIVLEIKESTAKQLTDVYCKSSYASKIPEKIKPEAFNQSVLLSLPFLRNKVSSSHGQGLNKIETSSLKSLAKLAVNLAATLNTYIIEEYINHNNIDLSKNKDIANYDEIPF